MPSMPEGQDLDPESMGKNGVKEPVLWISKKISACPSICSRKHRESGTII